MRLKRRVVRFLSTVRGRLGGEGGSVLVVVAVILPALLAAVALAVDLGSFWQAQRQAQSAADAAALAGAHYLPTDTGSATTQATTYAQTNLPSSSVSPETPYNSSAATIKVTVSKAAPVFFAKFLGFSSPTVSASAVATATRAKNNFLYAASTLCTAITITNGGDTFPGGIWSNGGITTSGSGDTAGTILQGNSACAFPSAFTSPTSATATATQTTWPDPLPPTPTSCTVTTGQVSIDSTWLSSHSPGIYCYTNKISIAVSNTTFNGYEFVSESTQSDAISNTNNGNTFTGYGSAGTGPIFYATAGGVAITGSTTINGDIYAPNGLVAFSSGSNVETGFIEANTIKLNNGPQTFNGTGTGGYTGAVSLIG